MKWTMMTYANFILFFTLLAIDVGLVSAWHKADAAPQLTLGCLNLPPYTSRTAPKQGVLSDVAATAARQAGYDARIILVPWKRLFQMAREGKVDGIFCTTRTEERLSFLSYSNEPISLERYVLFSLKERRLKVGPIETLTNYYFAEIPNSAWDSELRRKGITTILPISDEIQKFRALVAGRIDFALADELIGWASAKACCAADVETIAVSEDALLVSPQYISISKAKHKNAGQVAQRISDAIRELKDADIIERIYQKHGLADAYKALREYKHAATHSEK